ncbi:MAG TPA: DVUA0089 family protein [Rhodothermales bacterium]|nr:DVUA0089 family protein [Rhodothermales bacterium]
MTRFLLTAVFAATIALAGCDSYGIDDPTGPLPTDPSGPGDPTDPTPTDSTENPGPVPTNPELAEALGCFSVGNAGMGGALGGSLVETDCVLEAGRFPEYEGGEFLDAYAFTLDEETTVEINLDANAFDPVLALLNEDMEVLDFNDDRGPGDPADDEGSTIVQTLEAGTYVVVASSFFDGEQGTYTLRMTEE